MRPAHVSDATLRRVTFAVLLTSPAFVVAVAVLFVNDWLLKPALGNWLSGKLSDVAGVFALPLLLSAIFPSRRKAAFVLTALGFALWKTHHFAAHWQAAAVGGVLGFAGGAWLGGGVPRERWRAVRLSD